MRDIRVAAAQFEPRDNDPAFNLDRIEALTRRAADQGARIVSFHECCISGYTFLQQFDRAALERIAERVPDGPSTRRLHQIARKYGVFIMAGLVEHAPPPSPGGRLHNCYVTVGPDGFVTKYHKLHTFINPHLSPGDGHHVIDLDGIKAGFLICYDNNLPENTRATALMGAQVIFAPHVTGCVPSTMPGRGTVDRCLWDNRHTEPGAEALRREFDSMKGRGWLMRWLPARAWENGVYYVFTNNIGVDHDTIKPGLAMILDPFGEVMAESRELGDDVVVATLTADKYEAASGRRYIDARRPELYAKLIEPHPPGHKAVTRPGWELKHTK